jgi:hypothetical protein
MENLEVDNKDLCLGYEYLYDLYNDDVRGVCHQCKVRDLGNNKALLFVRRPDGFVKFEVGEIRNGKVVSGKRVDNNFSFKIHDRIGLVEAITMVELSLNNKVNKDEIQEVIEIELTKIYNDWSNIFENEGSIESAKSFLVAKALSSFILPDMDVNKEILYKGVDMYLRIVEDYKRTRDLLRFLDGSVDNIT